MSPFPDSPPAPAPRQGRPAKERVRTALRRAAGLSLAGLIVLLLGPAGLAAPCAPCAATRPGADCGAPACPGCPAMAAGARASRGTSDLTSPGAAGCDCEVAPAKAPPARVSAADGPSGRPTNRETRLSQVAGGAPEPGRSALAGRVPGSPPEPGKPLHLRNRILRI